MTRKRLRGPMNPDQLAETYAAPHSHRKFADHHLRVGVTTAVALWLHDRFPIQTVADLSAGDAAVANALPASLRILGDYAPGYPITGAIESTVRDINPVDLFICCETIEHLDDPEFALRLIRPKTSMLLLSTPVGAGDDPNPEHYWSWDRTDVENLLLVSGFMPLVYAETDLTVSGFMYRYGIWGCR